jgi:hypothetical protein
VLPGTYTLTLTQGAAGGPDGRVRIWSDRAKTTEFSSGTTWTHLNIPTEMYVEGLDSTRGVLGPSGFVTPDVTITMRFDWDILPGVKVPLAKASQLVTVTPVITQFETFPGNVALHIAGTVIGLKAVGKGVLPGGAGLSVSGADTTAHVFAANVGGAPGAIGKVAIGQPGAFLVQNAGYPALGAVAKAVAIVNGDGAITKGFTWTDGKGVVTTKDASITFKGVVQDRVLDRAGKGNPPTPPDYQSNIEGGGNNMITIKAFDFPGIGDDVLANVHLTLAVRDNFRLWLMWRFPAAGGQGTTIYPLASIDWTVFFRGTGSVLAADFGKAAFFAPTAAAVVTVSPFVVNHNNPIVVPPDFNDNLIVS